MSFSHVLTIIRPKNYSEDLETLIDSFTAHLDRMEVSDFSVVVLSENTAFDLFFNNQKLNDTDTVSSTLTGICANNDGFDWYIQSTDNRRKKMIVADMDSTMITIECIDELADFAGIKDQVADITERAMQGELDFQEALHSRVALLKGMSESVLDECYKDHVKFTDGAYELVQTMAKNGAVTALVSGGFTYFTAKVSGYLGFQLNRANILEIKDGALTGKIVPPISDSQTKINTLNELSAKHGIDSVDIIGVGDGANDIPMIEGAGLGAAYKAKEKARLAADFQINHTDLKSLLYVQGYSDSDMVTE